MVIGNKIPANDHAGPKALWRLEQNIAASTQDQAPESNHIIGVAPHTIANEIAKGTEIRATVIHDWIFALKSIFFRFMKYA